MLLEIDHFTNIFKLWYTVDKCLWEVCPALQQLNVLDRILSINESWFLDTCNWISVLIDLLGRKSVKLTALVNINFNSEHEKTMALRSCALFDSKYYNIYMSIRLICCAVVHRWIRLTRICNVPGSYLQWQCSVLGQGTLSSLPSPSERT